MSLGNQIKNKKTQTEKPQPELMSVTMPVVDWEIMKATFYRVAENVGKLSQSTQEVATIHTNCMAFIKEIEKGEIIGK